MKKDKTKKRPAVTVILMMCATVLAKLLGMLRSVITASHYGTSVEAEAFSIASVIPLTFFDMLFSAAILGCFIPVYNSFKNDDGSGSLDSQQADRFACIFFNVMLLLTSALALAGIIFAEPIITAAAGGKFADAGTKKLAVKLLRIMFPMIIFTGAAYTAVGIMQSKGKYLLPALISAVSNGFIILYLLFFDRCLGEKSIYGLCAAYLAAWLLQFLTLAVPLLKSGFRYQLLFDFKNPYLKRALKNALPIMAGSWLSPVTLLAGTFFSSRVDIEGSVTVLNYAYNLYVMIVGILTYSICNYVFPHLSRLSGSDRNDDFAKTVRTGILSSLFIVVPFMAAVEVLGPQGVSLLYMRGKFTSEAARCTSDTLRCITLAMPAFSVTEVLTRTFYSKNMQKIPMYAAFCGIAVNITLSFILTGIPETGMRAIGISIAAGQFAAAVCLIILCRKKIGGIFTPESAVKTAKILICGILSYAVMSGVCAAFDYDPFHASAARNFVCCAAVSAAGIAFYAVCTAVLMFIDKKRAHKNKKSEKEGGE